MRRMMKGDEGVSLMTIVLIMMSVSIIVSVTNNPIFSNFAEETGSRFETRYTVLTMQNALKSADIYMKTGGRYSVYQASYDVFRQGGFKEAGDGGSYNYWYDIFNIVTIPVENDFIDAISFKTREYINRYSSVGYNFMKKFSVVIPEYTVKLDSDLNTVGIVAETSENMVLAKTQSSGDLSSIEKSGDFTDTLTINLKGLHEKAKEISLEGITAEIKNGMEKISLPQNCDYSYSVTTAAEKNIIKNAIMAIKLSEPEADDYSFDISMVHSDTKRSPGTPCKHTLLGIAKVNITAEKFLPVLNEDGPNFAPTELIFLVRYAYTSTGETPTTEGLDIVPEEETLEGSFYIPEPLVPDVTAIEPGEIPSRCSDNKNYDVYITEASHLFNIDVDLIRAVICAESGFNPRALSSVGAKGLMQIMPSTFKGVDKDGNPVGLYYDNYCENKVGGETKWGGMLNSVTNSNDPVWDPKVNVLAGTCYLSKTYHTHKSIQSMDQTSKIRCTLAAYNAGPSRIDSIIRGYGEWAKTNCDPTTSKMPDETKNYVTKIMSYIEFTKTTQEPEQESEIILDPQNP